MIVTRVMYELRFSELSMAFVAHGFDIGVALAEKYHKWEAQSRLLKFYPNDGDILQFDTARILVDVQFPSSPFVAASSMAECVRVWREKLGSVPALQRVGLRALIATATDMSRGELISVADKATVTSDIKNVFGRTSDFAITLEDLDGADGYRLILGCMDYEEINTKWGLREDGLKEAKSFLVEDIDFGRSESTIADVEGYFSKTWTSVADLHKRVSQLILGSKPK